MFTKIVEQYIAGKLNYGQVRNLWIEILKDEDKLFQVELMVDIERLKLHDHSFE